MRTDSGSGNCFFETLISVSWSNAGNAPGNTGLYADHSDRSTLYDSTAGH